MSRERTFTATLVAVLTMSAAALGQPGRPATAAAPASKPLLTASVDPRAFGTQDYTVTTISATRFAGVHVSANLSIFCPPLDCPNGKHWYTTLNLPAGTIIDYIGVNTATTVDAAMGFTLHFRDHLGGTAPLASFSFPAHDFQTDLAGPFGILIPANVDRVFVLDVELAPGLADYQFFGFIEIWWKRAVSDPPATPTFGDVAASHPFYPFVEALAKSGITAGCAGGNYCPDAFLTRGQMAVFLAKALGLHWSN